MDASSPDAAELEAALLDTVDKFLERDVRPHVLDLEHSDTWPAEIVERMKEGGILLSTDGPLHNVIKIKPPLVVSVADAERIVTTLDAILESPQRPISSSASP